MSSSKIKKNLRDRNLSKAFMLLEERIKDVANYDLKNAFYDVQTTYKAMLTYLIQGYEDNEATKRRDDIIRTLFVINDRLDRLERLDFSDNRSRYVSAQKLLPTSISLSGIQQKLEQDLSDEEHETELCNMFHFVWTSDVWTKSEYETANNILSSESIQVNDKAVFISAVTLALSEMFDIRKLHLLLDAYLKTEDIINQRALVGIIISVRAYDSRLDCFPEIQTRLEMYADDYSFVKDMFSAMLMLQYSSITDKITSKLQNDIMPALMKKQESLSKMNKEELEEELTRNGENPEWMMDKTLEKKIKEMTELQIEGADVYMSTFRYMKGYSFFNKIPHWFYPFDFNSPLIKDTNIFKSDPKGTYLNVLLNNAMFCNSDLYSFCFMMNSIGEREQESVRQQINSQISDEDMNSMSEESKMKKMSKKEICRSYIFDLYRFYVCFPFFNQFDNPFKYKRKITDGTGKIASFSPIETNTFSFLLDYREEMLSLADFLMRKGIYEDAFAIYESANPQKKEDDASLWQKRGFCMQKLGIDQYAYNQYVVADELHPDSKWTMTHIAQLAQKLGYYDNAVKYYDILLQQDSENLKFIVNKAKCLSELNQYDEALRTLYKANYLDEDSISIRSMIVECQMQKEDFQKAYDMIQTIIISEECSIEIRILNSLLALNLYTKEKAYNSLLEASLFHKGNSNDKYSFTQYFDYVKEYYCDKLGIDKTTAEMLLDSVVLEIK